MTMWLQEEVSNEIKDKQVKRMETQQNKACGLQPVQEEEFVTLCAFISISPWVSTSRNQEKKNNACPKQRKEGTSENENIKETKDSFFNQ